MTNIEWCRRHRDCKYYWDNWETICIICRNEDRFESKEKEIDMV